MLVSDKSKWNIEMMLTGASLLFSLFTFLYFGVFRLGVYTEKVDTVVIEQTKLKQEIKGDIKDVMTTITTSYNKLDNEKVDKTAFALIITQLNRIEGKLD